VNRVNHDDEWDGERERPGWQWRFRRLGPRLGAGRIGASLYELRPGQRTFPYHYHHANEEWLLAVAGAPTLRTPEGERELEAGEVVCFPAGADGAHQVINRTDEPVRILVFSTMNVPEVVVYPDSGKIGVSATDVRKLFRADDDVDYFEGEDGGA
jgi:uncharacterized cupin superfamily protein